MEKPNPLSASVFCLILSCICLIHHADCAHIVGFAKLGLVSHNRVLKKLGQELKARGHIYTQILPEFAKETYDDVDIKIFNSSVTKDDIEDLFLTHANIGDYNKDMFASFEMLIKFVPKHNRIREQYCADILTHQNLISQLKASVDLILCDASNDCCSILADILNKTRVDVSTAGFDGLYGAYIFGYPEPLMYATLGISRSLPRANKFSFLNRLKGFLQHICFSLADKNLRLESLWEKHGKAHSKFKHAEDARKTHGIALIPDDFAIEPAFPLGANIKVIGPILPEPARKLPEYLDRFMNENKVVVVVSFGTIFSNYPRDLAQSIADELSQVSAAVLWRYSGEIPKNLGEKIKIIPWLPKNECSFNDVLGHSSTKVFVTHGGLNSFHESIYHGVPMVIIPMIGEQQRQAGLAQYKEIGVVIKHQTITVNSKVLQNAVYEVLSNNVYKENVQKLSTMMKDRKMTPSEEGADWIEYALRHDGAMHLVSETIDLSVYKLYMFDVLLFLLGLVCLFVYVLLRLCRCISGACCRQVQVKDKIT